MEEPFRKYSSISQYRYGFNGKEKDNDPVQYDYGFRIYDPRIVRFKSIDPLTKKYPELTPYQFASNRPIDGIDQDGLEFLKTAAAWVIQPKAFKADAFQFGTSKIYSGNSELAIRNLSAYEISAQHMADAAKFADKFTPREMNSDYKPYERGKVGFRASAWLNNFFSTSVDAVSEGMDLCFMFKVYGNMLKENFDSKTKDKIETAYNTWAGIAAANTLVKLASENSSFPRKLNSKEILTDLVNYVTDGTVDKSTSNYAYSNIISTWGSLIFNNREAIMKKTMNFSPERKTITTLTAPSGVNIPLIGVTGNSNPDVIKANELIKNKQIQSDSQVQSSN